MPILCFLFLSLKLTKVRFGFSSFSSFYFEGSWSLVGFYCEGEELPDRQPAWLMRAETELPLSVCSLLYMLLHLAGQHRAAPLLLGLFCSYLLRSGGASTPPAPPPARLSESMTEGRPHMSSSSHYSEVKGFNLENWGKLQTNFWLDQPAGCFWSGRGSVGLWVQTHSGTAGEE